MADTVAKLAYDEAVRTIKSQEGVLDNLRSRAGTLIAVASLVTSFLGGQVLAKPTLSSGAVVEQEIGTLGFIAIAMFVLVAAMAVAILWPYTWRFDMDATTILSWPTDDYEGALADLATYHEQNHTGNATRLTKLFKCFQWGCIFLVLETLAWILDLANWNAWGLI